MHHAAQVREVYAALGEAMVNRELGAEVRTARRARQLALPAVLPPRQRRRGRRAFYPHGPVYGFSVSGLGRPQFSRAVAEAIAIAFRTLQARAVLG